MREWKYAIREEVVVDLGVNAMGDPVWDTIVEDGDAQPHIMTHRGRQLQKNMREPEYPSRNAIILP